MILSNKISFNKQIVVLWIGLGVLGKAMATHCEKVISYASPKWRVWYAHRQPSKGQMNAKNTASSIRSSIGCSESGTPPLNANDVFQLIDDRCSLVEDCNDPEAVKRRSKQAPKAL